MFGLKLNNFRTPEVVGRSSQYWHGLLKLLKMGNDVYKYIF